MINESSIIQDTPMIASGIFKPLLIILLALIGAYGVYFISKLKKIGYQGHEINKSMMEHIDLKDKILENAYRLFSNQSQSSFDFALIFASISLFSFLLTTGFYLYRNTTDLAGVGVIATAFSTLASGIGFSLYNNASDKTTRILELIYQQKEEKKNTVSIHSGSESSQQGSCTDMEINQETETTIEETAVAASV